MKISLYLGAFLYAAVLSGSAPVTFLDSARDTLTTGLPIALFAGVWWAVANRVPSKWPDLSDPAASFIRTTWKEQGFAEADTILLKEIPADSVFAKVIMYTQELPHALAVGAPFRKKIEQCLQEQQQLQQALIRESSDDTRHTYQQKLKQVEKQLAQCRFVCGHERVHKERYHTYKMLVIQFVAPFVMHSLLHGCAHALEKNNTYPQLSELLKKNMTRSCAEMLVFWITAHLFEREADLHASTKPEEIQAGIDLFNQARASKSGQATLESMRMTVFVWFLKYTHPTTPERLAYLKKALKKIQNKRRHFLPKPNKE